MLLPLEVGAAWVPSGWSLSRLLSGTAGPTMMEDAKTSVARKGLPKSPAMSRATERPSRDGRLSLALAN